MGSGEWYLMLWHYWAQRLAQAQLLGYWIQYHPLPVEWLDWVAASFGYDDLEDMLNGGGEFAGIRWLEQQDLASFADFKTWYEKLWGEQVDESE